MGINVLSLFGGIETGLIALKELGIEIDNYYSSEIDKYASSVARFNHPEIIEFGDISNYANWKLPKIDLIFAGPPCQGFSIAGKGLDWDDPRSQLFFTAIEILWEYKPKYFLFENVASMKKDIVKEIDELMEVDSVKINSALVSAQNRKRNYWCNWDVEQPEDKGILLKDIIEGGFVDRDKSLTMTATYRFSPQLYEYTEQKRKQIVFVDKSQTIPATIYKENAKSMVKRNKKGLLVGCIQTGLKEGRAHEIGRRIYSEKGKCPTLMSNNSGGTIHRLVGEDSLDFRKLTVTECERLQTLPDGTTAQGINEQGELVKISNTQRYKMIGNGWTKDVIKHILSSSDM